MAAPWTYRPMTDADAARVVQLWSQAFGSTLEQGERWLRVIPPGRVWVAATTGEPPAACLVGAGIGQFFGGREVSMEGIAGVAVAPESRGTGLGSFLMREAVLEMHRRGVALSALYPATQPVYRRVGYELAGYSNQIRLDVSSIEVAKGDAPLRMRPARDDDWPRVEEAYRGIAAEVDGALARRTYIWPRIRVYRGDPTDCWVVEADGAVEGWVCLLLKEDTSDATGRKSVLCADLQAATPRAARRLLAFLATYESMVNNVLFVGGPNHPLLLLLPEQRWHSANYAEFWMLRIVDVERALAERGYPRGLTARLELRIEDDVIAENNGTFVLEVADGCGRVGRGSVGVVPGLNLHIRDVAPIYSGFQTPHAMARLGRVRGDTEALGVARSLFACGSPAMFDRF